jgi:hypothetical protein
METICSSETSVAAEQTTRCHVPDDDTLLSWSYPQFLQENTNILPQIGHDHFRIIPNPSVTLALDAAQSSYIQTALLTVATSVLNEAYWALYSYLCTITGWCNSLRNVRVFHIAVGVL